MDNADGTHEGPRLSRGTGGGGSRGEPEDRTGTEIDFLSPIREFWFYLKSNGMLVCILNRGAAVWRTNHRGTPSTRKQVAVE